MECFNNGFSWIKFLPQNGQKIPDEGEVVNAIKWAAEAGYRLVDTASGYGTEEDIGKALAETPVARKDMFIVTKVPQSSLTVEYIFNLAEFSRSRGRGR